MVEEALDSYADRIESLTDDRPMPLFWFVREAPEAQVELDLEIDPRQRRLFEAEARRQEVSIEQLLMHAIFLHIGAPAVHKAARIPVRI
ncbi:MAG TPA: hypothetical protein VG816_09135 [Solirubrobacterales bacterium]|nr:hypothetical protein [Solirubrobacterales bacterium]